MTSVSMLSNGKICSSWWNCPEYVADKFTWRKKPRSANIRVQRSLREVNAQMVSVEERYDSISIKARSARSSNVVHISTASRRRWLRSPLYTSLQSSWPMPFLLSCRSPSTSPGQHCLSASSVAVINDSSHPLFFARFTCFVLYYEMRREDIDYYRVRWLVKITYVHIYRQGIKSDSK